MNNIVKRDSCRLCKSLNLNQVLILSDAPIGDDYLSKDEVDREQETYPVNLMLCNSCGHLQLSHVINPEIIYKNYIYTSSSSLNLDNHFKEYADDLINRLNVADGSFIVDIGCNEGLLLKYFKERNMRVLGIDPAVRIVNKVNEEGIDCIADFFGLDAADKIKKEYQMADVVTANNVFANIDDLDKIIEAVKVVLNPNGVFVMESGYAVETIGNTILDNIHHEHLSYFSVKPLISFFKRHGLNLFDVVHTTSKGGSIRVFVQFKNGKFRKTRNVDHYLSVEFQNGIHEQGIYNEFQKKIKMEKERLLNILKELKKQGKVIAGFGAAIGSTQMLYNLDLKNYIDFLVDDNPNRIGLYSPGLKIPVYSSQEIYNKKPDAIVCLAWRYSKPIIEKHKKYIEDNGRFIIPFSNSENNGDYS